MCCCNSPRARARREARRAAKIAFAKKVFNAVTGNRYQLSKSVGEKSKPGYEDIQYGTTEEMTEKRPQMYARSLVETQLPSYDEVVEGSVGLEKEKN